MVIPALVALVAWDVFTVAQLPQPVVAAAAAGVMPDMVQAVVLAAVLGCLVRDQMVLRALAPMAAVAGVVVVLMGAIPLGLAVRLVETGVYMAAVAVRVSSVMVGLMAPGPLGQSA